jgi:hypothetical protein
MVGFGHNFSWLAFALGRMWFDQLQARSQTGSSGGGLERACLFRYF